MRKSVFFNDATHFISMDGTVTPPLIIFQSQHRTHHGRRAFLSLPSVNHVDINLTKAAYTYYILQIKHQNIKYDCSRENLFLSFLKGMCKRFDCHGLRKMPYLMYTKHSLSLFMIQSGFNRVPPGYVYTGQTLEFHLTHVKRCLLQIKNCPFSINFNSYPYIYMYILIYTCTVNMMATKIKIGCHQTGSFSSRTINIRQLHRGCKPLVGDGGSKIVPF